MKVWRDREGNWLTPSQFGSRFKEGVNKVTPLQQTKTQIFFTWITVVGIICGIVVTAATWKTLWWLCIILVAGLGNTIVGVIGIYQRYYQLKKVEDMIRLSIKEEHSNGIKQKSPIRL